MNISIVTNRAEQINGLHSEIISDARDMVRKAIEIGDMLSDQKAELAHGDFLPWLKANVSFSRQTAERYIKLHQHGDKMLNVGNLSEAYRQVETLEAQQKREEQREIQQKVSEHRSSGTKPKKAENRKVYEAYRRQEEDEAYEERVTDAFQEPDIGPSISADDIRKTVDESKRVIEEQEKHQHLNLATYAENFSQKAMFVAIERYINSFGTVSSQLEATHNLIKKLRLVAGGLQQKTARSDA